MSLSWLVYHCFSTSWALGFAEFVVDFVHNLHFQVKREKCECHDVAHHSLNTQASGTNNIKSTTELSPVLIRILLRFQNVASTRLLSGLIEALYQKKTRMRRVKSFTDHRGWLFCLSIFKGTLGVPIPSHLIKDRCCSLRCFAKLASNCPEIAHLIIQPNRKFEHNSQFTIWARSWEHLAPLILVSGMSFVFFEK